MLQIHRILNRLTLASITLLAAAYAGVVGYTGRTEHGSYVYRFEECTGPNQFIIRKQGEAEIHLKGVGDPIYLDLLQSLSWRVLYPSENQGKIILVGTYTPWTKEFRLERWFWQGNVAVLGGPEFWEEPGLRPIKVRPNLLSIDFCADEYRPCRRKLDLQKLGIVASSKRYPEKRAQKPMGTNIFVAKALPIEQRYRFIIY